MPVENFKLLTSSVFKLLRFKKCLSIRQLNKMKQNMAATKIFKDPYLKHWLYSRPHFFRICSIQLVEYHMWKWKHWKDFKPWSINIFTEALAIFNMFFAKVVILQMIISSQPYISPWMFFLFLRALIWKFLPWKN